ncbi:hypothetical protein PRZ48_013855 [Zasmidium cellare]|uniref:FAD-binding domain-containing protein n=1 Tax=Zasmidium cellare TaxID=395010 RepID=A0ABR0E307_ZASCE|nr:hypothetical protein PRZ48_013855 [Zasmidium cellare]
MAPITDEAGNQRRVLVVGGGPAGSTAAFWLAKAGFDVQVAELSSVAPYGQGIDVTDEAVAVVRGMGVLDTIKANTTGETGFALLDDQAREIGSLGRNPSEAKEKGISPSQEIEIMRGTLTKILVDAAKAQNVQYRYGCTVSSIDQHAGGVTVKLSDSESPEDFTAIIGADGVASQTRKLSFPASANANPFVQTDTYCAYFSMEADRQTRVPYSRLQHADKGRAIWIRPIDAEGKKVSCYFIVTSPNNAKLQDIARPGATQGERKAFLEELYHDMDGVKQEAVRGMHQSTDFYFSRIVQVALPTWHEGRCGLVGDAAYCPSPLSGQGTTLALIGGYMIAGELAANPADPAAAFEEYQRKFQGYVKEEGSIPLGGKAPAIFEPQSRLGLWILRTAFWGITRSGLPQLLENLPSFQSEGPTKKFRLPQYAFA